MEHPSAYFRFTDIGRKQLFVIACE